MDNERLEKLIKIRRIQDPCWNNRIKARIYNYVIWSDPCDNKKKLAKRDISFEEAFDHKIHKSVIGLFIDEKDEIASREIREAKLDIIKFNANQFDEREWEKWIEKNNFVENPIAAIVHAIINDLRIDREFLENILTALRLLSSKITSVDDSLRKLRNLKVLTLTDNFIQKITGSDLPRDLRLLELSRNEITSLESLCENPPKKLTYLGLSKNHLTNNSKLHLLNSLKNSLRVLDFQDNNFRYLRDLLPELGLLENLMAISLQGNPCSVCQGYKNAVLHYLPGIVYLDEIKLTEEDLKTNENFFQKKHMDEAVMYVYVYRIINLKKPPAEKNRTFAYFFEVELSLLDSDLTHKEEMAAILEENEKIADTIESSNISLDFSYTINNSKDNENPTKLRSVYKGNDIYHKESNNPPRVARYESKEFEWKECVYFDEPILKIPCANEDFEKLSDTFKSIVKVKLVCRKTEKKDRKATTNSQESRDSQAKIILCEFTCSLKNIPWTDRSEDFYWDETHNFTAVPCHPGSLALLKYTMEDTKRSKNSGTQKIETSKSNDIINPPKLLTVQMGFGLERIPNFSIPTITEATAIKRRIKDKR